MTSEEKAEKNRVMKRLTRALKMREIASLQCEESCLLESYETNIKRWDKLNHRVNRISATLRGYD